MDQTEDPLYEQVRYFLEARLLASRIRLKPPKDPRRTKRLYTKSRWHNNDSLLILIASLHPNAPKFLSESRESDEEWFQELAMDAVRTGDSDFWLAVVDFTKKAQAVWSQPAGRYPLPVYAIQGRISIHYKTGLLPTKSQIKQFVINAAREAGTACPAQDESSRWTEIFRAAGLSALPNAKPKRGLTRNGNK